MPDSESVPLCYPEIRDLVLVKKKTIILLTGVFFAFSKTCNVVKPCCESDYGKWHIVARARKHFTLGMS